MRLIKQFHNTIKGAVRQPGFVQTNDADILKIKRGGGCQSAFGLPFLFAGLFILQIPFRSIPVEIEEGPIVLALILPLGLVFALAGAALLLIRSEIAINRRSRTITQWWGLLIPMKRTVYQFDAFERVRLDIHAGDRDSGDTCIIHLIGSGQPSPFYIPSPADHEGARKASEQLSQFLGIPFEDTVAEKTADTN